MARTDEDAIRAVIGRWERAVRAGDMAGVLDQHTDDILMFDVPPPFQSIGLPAYRATWELFFRYAPPSDDAFVIDDLRVTAGSDVAFATGLLRIGGSPRPVCRLTVGLVKASGAWLIAHEHHSAPHELYERSSEDE